MRQKIERREFLKASVGTAAVLGAPRLFAGGQEKKTEQKLPQEKQSQVAAIRGDNLEI